MEIRQSFELEQPIATTWNALSDVPLVAACLPGAELTDELGDDRYKGKVTVKLGPILAAFSGEVEVQRDASKRSGTVIGKGADSRSGSRAQANMTYSLVEVEPGKTRVDMVSDITLSGALAQFGRTAIVNDIAAKLTSEFVKNLKARLAAEVTADEGGAPAPSAPREGDRKPALEPRPAASPTKALNAGSLIWTILRDRIGAFVRRLLGKNRSQHRETKHDAEQQP